MIRETANALVACVVTFLICAVAYPAVVWGLAWLVYPRQAAGSVIERDGKVIGSELIAQPFASDKYFQPRPSAVDYKADATGGSNLGPNNPDLRKKIAERAEALKATDKNPAPVELVTASGGGMDPHITLEGAYYQIDRVAGARKMSADQVRGLIDRHVETSGELLGAPARVNVLLLNLALDADKPASAASAAGDVKPAAASGGSASTDAAKPPPGGPAVKESSAAREASVPELSDEVKEIRSRVGDLSGRIERLHKQLDAIAEGDKACEKTREGVKDLEQRVSKLSDQSRAVPRLVAQVDGLLARLDEAEGSVRRLRDDVRGRSSAVKALGDRVSRASETHVGTAGAADGGTVRSNSAVDLRPGLDPFRRGQYAEAANAFRAAAREHPEDARLWYYAALANGLATNQWGSETEQLVTKGVDRERAGTPSAAEIDSAFADLTKTTGRDWLSYYRRRAAQR
jgi:K+-transporting ATPase ATPase C chain